MRFNQTRRGVSLSGGQKARQVTFDIFQHCQSAHTHHRVALARAVYARTKYVLLDDPLSAVVRDHHPLELKTNARRSFRIVTLRGSCMKSYCVVHF